MTSSPFYEERGSNLSSWPGTAKVEGAFKIKSNGELEIVLQEVTVSRRRVVKGGDRPDSSEHGQSDGREDYQPATLTRGGDSFD